MTEPESCSLLIFLLRSCDRPKVLTLDLSYRDNVQLNVAPGMNMMKDPGRHEDLGLYPHHRYDRDLKNIPEEVQNKVVNVAAGYDHIVALDENGAIYVWGPTSVSVRTAFRTSSRGLRPTARTRHQADRGQQPVSPRQSPEDGELFLLGQRQPGRHQDQEGIPGQHREGRPDGLRVCRADQGRRGRLFRLQKDNALVRIPEA